MIALRTLRKQWGFSSVVVISLALAISLNTTMYSVLDALIHPRVDVREPDRLFKFRFYGDFPSRTRPARVPGHVRDSLIRASAPSIEALAWHDPISAYRRTTLSSGPLSAEAPVAPVSIGYMPLMGPKLVAGRWFVASDENASPRPIMISEQVAKGLFAPGADPMGRTVFVGDTAFVVIGVLSRYAEFPGNPARAWTLLSDAKRKQFQSNSWIARVRPGVTRADLEGDLKAAAERIAAISGEPARDDAFRVEGPTKQQVALKSLHLALIYAVVAVLLVACANVANMQLARGLARGRELALRAALGASRARIVRHLLVESTLLAVAGLVLGLVLTFWGASVLRSSVPPAVGEYIVEPQLNWRVFVFALVATVTCILLVGLAPAIKVSRADPNDMLKRGHGTGATRRNRRQYAYLVVAEMGLALFLLSSATVVVRGALAVDDMLWPGFDMARVAGGYLRPESKTTNGRPTPEVLAELQQRIAGIPGVEQAAIDVATPYENSSVVLADSSGMREIVVGGYSYRTVTPNLLRAERFAIIAGRDFRDGERDVPAVIVDELTARKLWPNASPIGALIKLGDLRSNRPFVRVVGVFARRGRDGKPRLSENIDLLNQSIGMVLYLPSMRDTVRSSVSGFLGTLTVRTSEDAARVLPELRRRGVMSADTYANGSGYTKTVVSRNFMAKVFALFAALGLGLAAFGVYGVVAHSVVERRRELGVRVALGATPRDIYHAVLRESVVIALAGVALGLLLTKVNVGMVAQLSFGYDIFNAPLFAVVALAMFGVAAASAFVPARRATRVDPTESLRSE